MPTTQTQLVVGAGRVASTHLRLQFVEGDLPDDPPVLQLMHRIRRSTVIESG